LEHLRRMLEEPALKCCELWVIRPEPRVLRPQVAVSAEVEAESLDLWEGPVQTLLAAGEEEVTEQLIQVRDLHLVRLRGLEVEQHVPGYEVRITPTDGGQTR